jgi:integrase
MPREEMQYQPLPDAFTGAAGARALYFSEHVGPTLLDALEACRDNAQIEGRASSKRLRGADLFGRKVKARARAKALNPAIASWRWRDGVGSPLLELRYKVRFRGFAGKRFSWPPTTYAQAESALQLLQASHLFLIALSDGGRHGEILSVPDGAILRGSTETPVLSGRTRKLDPNGGRARETPIPIAVQAAVAQQERLARYFKSTYRVDGSHLWVQTKSSRGTALASFTKYLDSFVKDFGLESEMSGTKLHMHRFRKTLARICALALVHAPKILMDVFGHRDEQMTVLRYILSDPGLLSEIQEITRELLVLKGVWVVENLDSLQGKGAERLRERWGQQVELVGQSAYEPQNIQEFIRAMFENGSSFAVVAPGILCTGFTRGGRCNVHANGQPNPEHCDSRCENLISCPSYESPDSNRSEDAIVNAMNTADYLFSQLQEAARVGEPMLATTFESQIRSLLGRWREVDGYVASHPLGKRLIPARLLP